MYQPDPAIIREVRERPALVPGDVASPQPGQFSSVRPAISLIADPLGQHFDAMARPPVQKSNNWAVWWSDLMMAMFVMFAALYIFQVPQKKPLGPVPEAPTVAEQYPARGAESLLLRMYEQGQDLILQNRLEDLVVSRLVPEKNMRLILAGEHAFDQGQARLKPRAKSAVQVLAPILRQGPYKLTVVGHVDNDEKQGSSAPWDLSMDRAKAVAHALLEFGVPEEATIVVGYAHKVVAPSKPGQPALGRRVEIVLSSENPTDPLSADEISKQSKAGIRAWMSSSRMGGI